MLLKLLDLLRLCGRLGDLGGADLIDESMILPEMPAHEHQPHPKEAAREREEVASHGTVPLTVPSR